MAETTSEGGAAVQGEVADASNENEDATDTEGADGMHRRNVRVSAKVYLFAFVIDQGLILSGVYRHYRG